MSRFKIGLGVLTAAWIGVGIYQVCRGHCDVALAMVLSYALGGVMQNSSRTEAEEAEETETKGEG